jgi:hypothetical protein
VRRALALALLLASCKAKETPEPAVRVTDAGAGTIAIDDYPAVTWIAYMTVIGGVLGGGYLANYQRIRMRVLAHVLEV